MKYFDIKRSLLSLVIIMQSNELKTDLIGLSSSSSNAVTSATASSSLPPPTLMPSSDLEDNTSSSLSHGHMSKVNNRFLFF